MKNVLCSLLCVCSIVNAAVIKRDMRPVRDKVDGNPTETVPKAYDTCKMDVRLVNITDPAFLTMGPHGFVDILLPPFPRPLFICFPTGVLYLSQIILLGHVACRQMGYMTVNALHSIAVPRKFGWFQGPNAMAKGSLLPRGVTPSSWDCRGHEQTMSQCSWQDVSTEECRALLDVECGECQKVINDMNGTIKTPGYPFTYIYDVHCTWIIEAPDNSTISLNLEQLSNHTDQEASFACESCKPEIEIVYSNKTTIIFNRYHDFSIVKDIHIPSSKVEIKFFSGLYSPQPPTRQKGFEIFFQAIPKPGAGTDKGYIRKEYYGTSLLTSLSYVLWAILVWFLISGMVCICWYLQQGVWKMDSEENQPSPSVETEIFDCEFEQCKVDENPLKPKGLRLRSPNPAMVEDQSQYITAISTPVEIPDIKVDHYSETIRRPPCLDEDNAYNNRVRANLFDRYSRNSQSGLILENGNHQTFNQISKEEGMNFLQVNLPPERTLSLSGKEFEIGMDSSVFVSPAVVTSNSSTTVEFDHDCDEIYTNNDTKIDLFTLKS